MHSLIIDIIVLAVLFASAGIAFFRGFIRETLTILGVGGGMAAAWFGGPYLQPHMREWFGVEDGVVPERLFGILPYDILADILSYGAIFIGVVVVLSLVSHILAETARSIGLGAIDRTLGVIFGMVRGILLLGLVYLPFHLYVEDEVKQSWFGDTVSHFYLEQTAIAIANVLPDSAKEEMDEQKEKMEDAAVSTRERLEGIDLLKKDQVEKLLEKEPDNTQGYQEEFRDQMDELFERETEEDSGQQE